MARKFRHLKGRNCRKRTLSERANTDRGAALTLLDTIFELIDLRSFGNIWFWLVVAAVWSGASQRVLGVPWDMATRARRSGEGSEAMADLEEMVRIHTGRILGMAAQSGLLLAGLAAFGLTSLALLGFVYGNAFSQALFLLGFPLTLVQMLSLRAARVIRTEGAAGAALIARLARYRLKVQGIALIAIFVTALWGMLHNMTAGVLG